MNTYTIEHGYIKNGVERVVGCHVFVGTPRLGAYNKIVPVENSPYPAEYAKLGFSHLFERVTVGA